MRTLRNLRKIGIKEYAHQMQYMGDTKTGTYIASDKFGNKYYENLEDELPRTPLCSSFSPTTYPPSSLHQDIACEHSADPGLPNRCSANAMGRLRTKRI